MAPPPRVPLTDHSLTAGATLFFIWRYGATAQLIVWFLGYYVFNVLTIFGVHSQHTFNPAYCRPKETWSFEDSALKGSCFHSTFGFGWFFRGRGHLLQGGHQVHAYRRNRQPKG